MNYIEFRCKGILLDTDANINVPLFFKITDLSEFGSRAQSYSLTVSIPATAKNKKFFKNIDNRQTSFNTSTPYKQTRSNVNTQIEFDFNDLNPCEIKAKGVTVFDGYMNFKEIVKKNGYVYYNFQLIGDKSKWVNPAKNIRLRDVSSLELCWNITNATDFTADEFVFCNIINQWEYFENSLLTTSNVINVKNLTPAIRAKYLIEQIFNTIGYNINSNFLESAEFSEVVIPCVTSDYVFLDGLQSGLLMFEGLRPIDQNDNATWVNINSNPSPPCYDWEFIRFTTDAGGGSHPRTYVVYDPYYDTNPSYGWDYDELSTPDCTDDADAYNVPDIVGGCVANLKYNTKFSLQTRIYNQAVFQNAGSASGTFASYTDSIAQSYSNAYNTTWDVVGNTLSYSNEIELILTKNGVTIDSGVPSGEVVWSKTFVFSASTFGSVVGTTGTIDLYVDINETIEVELEPNVEYTFVWVVAETNIVPGGLDSTLWLDTDLRLRLFFDSASNEGRTFDLFQNLPDVSAFDMFHNIAKMFNLYVNTVEDTKTVYIETRNDYLAQLPAKKGGFLNWTGKTDISKEITEEQTSKDLPFYAWFRYKRDSSDYYLSTYDENNEFPLGDYRIETVNNTDLSEKTVTQIDFAPTEYVILNYNTSIDGTPCPIMLKQSIPNNTQSRTGMAMRIMKARFVTSQLKYEVLYDGSTALYQDADGYPIAFFYLPSTADGFISGLSNLRFDDIESGDGLFAKYYETQYNQIIEGRLIEQYMYLQPADVVAFDFSKLIFIDRDWYYCQEISNYQPAQNRPVKVKLIQL